MKFVKIFSLVAQFGEIHRRRSINNNLTTQIGFFFILFRIHFSSTGKYLPVNIFGRFSLVIDAMFRKFY